MAPDSILVGNKSYVSLIDTAQELVEMQHVANSNNIGQLLPNAQLSQLITFLQMAHRLYLCANARGYHEATSNCYSAANSFSQGHSYSGPQNLAATYRICVQY